MDYENALMDDFDSDSDNILEIGVENESTQVEIAAPKSLAELLQKSRTTSVEAKLQQLDAMDSTSYTGLSLVKPLIPEIRRELEKYADSLETEYMDLVASLKHQEQSEEYRFLVQLSDLPTLIVDEIRGVQRYVAARYKVVFPELETLISSAVDYCRIVMEIGQDLANVRSHEPALKQILAPDKLLTVVMAALQQYPNSFTLSNEDMEMIMGACKLCLELDSFLQEILSFISGKLAKYAPNVAAIIGAVATSQLLIATGSLVQLALTPACNIASFGVKDLLAQQKGSVGTGFVRATGYLYQCPLVVGLPPEITKQALRIISAKVVLAARVDISRTSADGAVGQGYEAQIRAKIDKLLAPPEHSSTKALPVPKEQKLKKRGGRRFRKMKERFQMSELRKAQNKMQFGQQEQSVVDSFGDEVGLGMSGHAAHILANRNTDARMSKAMVGRLQQQKGRESLDTIVLAPVVEKRPREHEPTDTWGTMKRQRVDEDEI